MNINGLSFGTLDSPTYMPSFIGDLSAKYWIKRPPIPVRTIPVIPIRAIPQQSK